MQNSFVRNQVRHHTIKTNGVDQAASRPKNPETLAISRSRVRPSRREFEFEIVLHVFGGISGWKRGLKDAR
jgi:hypothetical protein